MNRLVKYGLAAGGTVFAVGLTLQAASGELGPNKQEQEQFAAVCPGDTAKCQELQSDNHETPGEFLMSAGFLLAAAAGGVEFVRQMTDLHLVEENAQ